MPPRTTFSGSSPSPVDGDVFLNEYAQRLKSLFDAAAFPLTAVAGTGNAVTASLDPPLDPGGLVNGMKFTITWAAANTGTVTLAINGGTAVPVVDADNVALAASALAAGRRSLIEFVGSSFRILSSAGGGAVGAGPAYQAFTTSGTWTKPTGYDPDTVVTVEIWAAGGGNNGGGGAYAVRSFRIADLPSSVTVTVGAGGSAAGGSGGNSAFGSLLTAFGGGGGNGARGGGGGGETSAGAAATASLGGDGGSTGGGNGASASRAGIDALTVFGGGGGAGNSTPTSANRNGNAVFGGGGGAVAGGTPGASAYGGNGGANGVVGSIPAGGGGGGAAGARGECRIWIFG